MDKNSTDWTQLLVHFWKCCHVNLLLTCVTFSFVLWFEQHMKLFTIMPKLRKFFYLLCVAKQLPITFQYTVCLPLATRFWRWVKMMLTAHPLESYKCETVYLGEGVYHRVKCSMKNHWVKKNSRLATHLIWDSGWGAWVVVLVCCFYILVRFVCEISRTTQHPLAHSTDKQKRRNIDWNFTLWSAVRVADMVVHFRPPCHSCMSSLNSNEFHGIFSHDFLQGSFIRHILNYTGYNQ